MLYCKIVLIKLVAFFCAVIRYYVYVIKIGETVSQLLYVLVISIFFRYSRRLISPVEVIWTWLNRLWHVIGVLWPKT